MPQNYLICDSSYAGIVRIRSSGSSQPNGAPGHTNKDILFLCIFQAILSTFLNTLVTSSEGAGVARLTITSNSSATINDGSSS